MDGFDIARELTKKHAKTFYFSSLFLRPDKRAAAYAVYAVCRISDEAVDVAGGSPADNLETVAGRMAAAYGSGGLADPLLEAFRSTVRRYAIPQRYFDELLAGMRMDLLKTRYQDFAELEDYCYKVAGVVGLIMLRIFGSDDPDAPGCAVNMGTAMQLTNILRDVKEDFSRSRIYLPQEELQRFGVSEAEIAAGRVDERFKALMRFQIERARDYYRKAARGIPLIADRNSRFVAAAMSELYAGILTAVERNGFDVFSKRASVGTPEKLRLLARIILGRKPLSY